MILEVQHVVTCGRHTVEFFLDGEVVGWSTTHDRLLSQLLAFNQAVIRDDIRHAFEEGTLTFSKRKTLR